MSREPKKTEITNKYKVHEPKLDRLAMIAANRMPTLNSLVIQGWLKRRNASSGRRTEKKELFDF